MFATLLTVLVLAIVHLAAGTTAALGFRWRPRALSAASGVSVAYVTNASVGGCSSQG